MIYELIVHCHRQIKDIILEAMKGRVHLKQVLQAVASGDIISYDSRQADVVAIGGGTMDDLDRPKPQLTVLDMTSSATSSTMSTNVSGAVTRTFSVHETHTEETSTTGMDHNEATAVQPPKKKTKQIVMSHLLDDDDDED